MTTATAKPQLPVVPFDPTQDGPTVVGVAGITCVVCDTVVPIEVLVDTGPDEDGDPCLLTRGDTFELDRHMLEHLADGTMPRA